ncbi:LacI family DNA-binding transcriptional regulator [Arcanobacterium phocae]|uniref:LacI family DNA-binding transcriptional regulator n=1 Tax=Arcanobacterium phocae TaxID=131112 RepID=UPI00209E0A53|nr:LacI family DNA-binding transcriptional regulator [Arcanobacterium phocae]
MATRADVARLAGVSPSTVSYVLNGERPTTPETQMRVRKAIEELGYVPHRWAGNLAARSLRTIGLHFSVGDHGIDEVAGEYISGMKDRAADLGIVLTIPVLATSEPEDFRYFLRSRVVDALIMMEVVSNDWREPIVEEENIPAIFLGSPGTGRVPFIESDFVDIGHRAMKYSAERGFRRSLVVVRSEDRSDFVRASELMIQGVRQDQQSLSNDVTILRLPSSPMSAFDILDRLSQSSEHTVVMGDNYEALSTLMSISPRFGLTVGQDYSLVSFGGSYHIESERSLRTTECGTDRYEMGRMCVDCTVARFNGEADLSSVFFPARIVEGGTVA